MAEGKTDTERAAEGLKWLTTIVAVSTAVPGGMPSALRMPAIVDRATRCPTFFNAP